MRHFCIFEEKYLTYRIEKTYIYMAIIGYKLYRHKYNKKNICTDNNNYFYRLKND